MKNIGGFSLLVGHVNTGIVEVRWDLIMATLLDLLATLATLANDLLSQLNMVQPVLYWFASFDFCNFPDILLSQFLYIPALYLITLIRLLGNVKVEIGVKMLITRSCCVLLFLSFLVQEFEDSLQSWRDLHDVLFPSQGSDWDWWLSVRSKLYYWCPVGCGPGR